MAALGPDAYFLTLTPGDLDPTISDHASGLYGEPVETFFAAVASAFQGPLYAVAEVGRGEHTQSERGRLHMHVVAHKNDIPAHILRDTERCKKVYDAPGLYRYLAKPPEPYSLEAALDHAAARATGGAAHTRRHFLGPERLAWAAAQCTNDQTLPSTPSTPPSTTTTSTATLSRRLSRITGRRAARAPSCRGRVTGGDWPR